MKQDRKKLLSSLLIANMMGNNQKLRRRIPFLVFVASMFIGILLGLILGNLTAGILIGLGAGLILMVLFRFILYRKNGERDSNATP